MQFTDVVEFFTSFQGEGPRQGQRATFIRFKKCNLNCPFCDTQFKTKSLTAFDLKFETVLNSLDSNKSQYIVFTGGEPLLPTYRNQISMFMEYTSRQGRHCVIGIETNGIFLVDFLNDLTNKVLKQFEIYCSPKFFQYAELDNFESILTKLLDLKHKVPCNIYFKFVNYDTKLISKMVELCLEYNVPNTNIYIMPMGRNATELLLHTPDTIELIMEYKVNFSSRLHILGMVP